MCCIERATSFLFRPLWVNLEEYLCVSCKLTHGKGIINKKLIGGKSDTSVALDEPIREEYSLSRINLPQREKIKKKLRYFCAICVLPKCQH